MTDLGFFDANVVVGRIARPSPAMRTEPGEVLAELERHDVREALIAHGHAIDRSFEDNAEILPIVAAHPGTRAVFTMPQHTTLDFPDPEASMGQMLDAGVAAVRITPSRYNGYTCDPWALGPMWQQLEAAHMPVLLATTDLGRYPDQPALGFSAKNLYDTAKAFPGIPIVILRINFSSTRVLVPLMRECPNVYAELSFYTAHHGYETLVNEVGADRLLFGSGMPWGPPGPSVVATTYAKISEDDKRLIAGDNLRRLIGAVGR